MSYWSWLFKERDRLKVCHKRSYHAGTNDKVDRLKKSGDLLRCMNKVLTEVERSRGAMSISEIQQSVDSMWVTYFEGLSEGACISSTPIMAAINILEVEKSNPFRKLRFC